MKFGQYLQQHLFTPWKDKYIDYDSLKQFLKRKQIQNQGWTHTEEAYFANKLLIAELCKVRVFSELEIDRLRETNNKDILVSFIKLNAIGFQKILKKHDKWTGINLTSSVHFRNIGDQFENLLKRAESVHMNKKSKIIRYWIHPSDTVKIQAILSFYLKNAPIQNQSVTTVYFDDKDKLLYYYQLLERQCDGQSISAEWTRELTPKSEVLLEHKTYNNLRMYENDMPLNQRDHLRYEQFVLNIQRQRQENLTTAKVCEYIQANSLTPMLKCSRNRTMYDELAEHVKVTLCENLIYKSEPELSSFSIEDSTSQIYKFPHALLEVKLDAPVASLPSWLVHLIEDQLIWEVPFFSIYIHGISCLFGEKVSLLPWWSEESKLGSQKRMDYAVSKFNDPSKDPNILSQSSHLNLFEKNDRSLVEYNSTSVLGKETIAVDFDQIADINQLRESRLSTQTIIDGRRKSFFSDKVTASLETMKHGIDVYHQDLSTQSNDDMSMALWLVAKLTNDKSVLFPDQSVIKKSKKRRIEPKIFFSNEQTFINWLQFSALLLTVSLGLINFGDHISRVSGAFFIIVSIILAFYAHLRFQYRSWQIRYRSSSRFDDIYGPVVLCLVFIIASFVNLGLRISQPIPSIPTPFSYNMTRSYNASISLYNAHTGDQVDKLIIHGDRDSNTKNQDAQSNTTNSILQREKTQNKK